MKKDQIILLKDRGLISLNGTDAKHFLQNITTNDLEKVNFSNSIFSAIFTPQGKYLFEFFIIKSIKGYLIDCDHKFTDEIISYFSKYKLKSNIEIKDFSTDHVVGIINLEKFLEIQDKKKGATNTIIFRDSPVFIDSRNRNLGARILSNLENLHLTIKKLGLKIIEPNEYYFKAHSLGIPIIGVENLKEQLFGLEANFEELQAIDFKKGCFIGQENTARMKLKDKLRKRLLPVEAEKDLVIGQDLYLGETKIGKILINKPFPFALVKLFDPDLISFKDKKLTCNDTKVRIVKSI